MAARVDAWRQSGATAPEFCKGKEFSPGGLRYWSSRLRQIDAAPEAKARVRLARIVTAGEGEIETPIVVEAFGVRVGVRRGFDRQALGAVLDVLAGRGAPR